MMLSKAKMLATLRNQLALDMNSSPEDFLQDGIVFCEAKLNDGRRMFDRQTPFLEIATMGKSIVVSADAVILPKIRALLAGKTRDDIFAAPFVYGHSLYYLPDCDRIQTLPMPAGFDYHVKEGKEIHELYHTPGFYNAIQYDVDHPRPDVLAVYAALGHEIVAVAGASADSQTMWQIGIDVLPQFRNRGLATALVSYLAVAIMERGIVPYYGTASSNIASQAVAHRSGFMPTWMCSYRNTFDGTTPYESDVKIMF